MTDREFITTKEIIIPKGTRIENWSNEDKENGTFSFVLGLDNDHVIMPTLDESDIDELVRADFIKVK